MSSSKHHLLDKKPTFYEQVTSVKVHSFSIESRLSKVRLWLRSNMFGMTGWSTQAVRRPVPESDRLRAEAMRMKGEADRLTAKADELIAEAEKLEMAEKSKKST